MQLVVRANASRREIRAVIEPVNHRVDSAVEQRQEDVQSAARLRDQARPNEELGRLSDGVLASMRPVGVEVWWGLTVAELLHLPQVARHSSARPQEQRKRRSPSGGGGGAASRDRQRPAGG